jgi:cystathionine gamma-synthase
VVTNPIDLSATFHQGGPTEYAREHTAIWASLEEAVGVLEGGAAVALSSGMAAVAAVLELVPPGGVVVVPDDAYTGTRLGLGHLESLGRVIRRVVDVADAAAVGGACEGAALVWLESPTNPLLELADLAAAAGAAHASGALVAVDNTFATPLLQQPLALGADLVVHSATKFLSGHSDVVLGVVAGRPGEPLERVREHRTRWGAIPGPFESWLALRGLRTLAVRLERAQATAALLAERLERHPAVFRVRYPGLAGHPGHDLARRQMDGPGAMLSFELADAATADRFLDALELATVATSLGGVETLLERRSRRRGEEQLPPGLVRVSVGLEDGEDLWADLGAALDRAGRRG